MWGRCRFAVGVFGVRKGLGAGWRFGHGEWGRGARCGRLERGGDDRGGGLDVDQ